MRTANKKTIALLVCLGLFMLLPGCTDWKKKYNAQEVEKKNLQGLLTQERGERDVLTEQVAKDQMTIEELNKKIAAKESTAKASGFGEGYDVKFDAAAGTVTVTLPNSILFNPGSADLKSATSKELDHIDDVLKKKYAGLPIDVIGHTDTDPIKKSKWKDNWELSTQRSLSVVRYLVERGIPKEKIRAIGRGDSQPLVPNKTAADKAKNRRVEIVAHMK